MLSADVEKPIRRPFSEDPLFRLKLSVRYGGEDEPILTSSFWEDQQRLLHRIATGAIPNPLEREEDD